MANNEEAGTDDRRTTDREAWVKENLHLHEPLGQPALESVWENKHNGRVIQILKTEVQDEGSILHFTKDLRTDERSWVGNYGFTDNWATIEPTTWDVNDVGDVVILPTEKSKPELALDEATNMIKAFDDYMNEERKQMEIHKVWAALHEAYEKRISWFMPDDACDDNSQPLLARFEEE